MMLIQLGQEHSRLHLWHCYHPNNWRPHPVSSRNYTEPLIVGQMLYLGVAQDDRGRLDGYFLATASAEVPIMTSYWKERGWQFKSTGTITKVSADQWQHEGGELLV